MDGGKAKHPARKFGLGQAGYNATTIRGGPQGVGNVLQGGVTSDITIWFRDLGPFGGNVKEGRRRTHIFSQTDHKETSAVDSRQDMGDAQVGSSAGSGGKIFGNDLYR